MEPQRPARRPAYLYAMDERDRKLAEAKANPAPKQPMTFDDVVRTLVLGAAFLLGIYAIIMFVLFTLSAVA